MAEPVEATPDNRLSAKWHDWATSTLGDDPDAANAAAAAGALAASKGIGFNAAADAARAAWSESITARRQAVTQRRSANFRGRLPIAGIGCLGGCILAGGALLVFLSLSFSLFAVADVCTLGCQSDPELGPRLDIVNLGLEGGVAAGVVAAVGSVLALWWQKTGAAVLAVSALVAIAALAYLAFYYPSSPASNCSSDSWCDAPGQAGAGLVPGAVVITGATVYALVRLAKQARTQNARTDVTSNGSANDQ